MSNKVVIKKKTKKQKAPEQAAKGRKEARKKILKESLNSRGSFESTWKSMGISNGIFYVIAGWIVAILTRGRIGNLTIYIPILAQGLGILIVFFRLLVRRDEPLKGTAMCVLSSFITQVIIVAILIIIFAVAKGG